MEREAGGGHGLAVALFFFVRDMESDAFGELGKFLLQHLAGGFENQVASRARSCTRPSTSRLRIS